MAKILEFHHSEILFQRYKENCTHELFRLCLRAVGNPGLKRLWITFIEANAYFLECERKEEVDFFEELCGNKDLSDIYDLVDSPPSKASKNLETDKEISLGSATNTILSTLDTIKSLTIDVSVRKSPTGDFQCEVF